MGIEAIETRELSPESDREHFQYKEFRKCEKSVLYFVYEYIKLLDPGSEEWKKFKLWPAQVETLQIMAREKQTAVLKARQLGLSWLSLSLALWLATFSPNSVILIFSKSDTEAMELLGRIKGMHRNLPAFLRDDVLLDNNHEYKFANGSKFQSFATTSSAGRSYTANLVIVDEADFIPTLGKLITSVKPTIDAQGQLILISTTDKDYPNSRFKRLWRDARKGLNDYHAIFLPWSARPERDEDWYKKVSTSGYTQDELWQEYPETAEQALSGRRESKRFNMDAIEAIFYEREPIYPEEAPMIPGLVVYNRPFEGGLDEQARRIQPGKYLIAVDTSEGDITSDPSPMTVFNTFTWEEEAHVFGVFEPSVLAAYAMALGEYYNNAVIAVERNNHGHAAILALESYGYNNIYKNPFDKKNGWLNSVKMKPVAVDKTAEAINDKSLILHTQEIKLELMNIEAATLKAPEGDTDDRAMTIVIGVACLVWPTIQVDPHGAMYYSYRRKS